MEKSLSLLNSKEFLDTKFSQLKLAMALSTFLGFLYLLGYTIVEKVPFPFSLKELPTLLLVLIFVGALLVLAIVSVTFLPVFSNSGIIGSPFSLIFEKINTRRGKILTYFKLSGFLFASTMLFFLFMALNIQYWWSLLIGIVLELLFSCYMLISARKLFNGLSEEAQKKTDGINDFYRTVFFLFLTSIYWFTFVTFFAIKLFQFVDTQWIHVNQSISCAIMIAYLLGIIVLHYLLVVAVRPNRQVFLVIGLLLVFIPTVVQPISAWICSQTLNLLEVGGGTPVIYHFDKQQLDSIPEALIEHDNVSKKLFVMLALGDTVRVRTDMSKKDSLISIDKKLILSEEKANDKKANESATRSH